MRPSSPTPGCFSFFSSSSSSNKASKREPTTPLVEDRAPTPSRLVQMPSSSLPGPYACTTGGVIPVKDGMMMDFDELPSYTSSSSTGFDGKDEIIKTLTSALDKLSPSLRKTSLFLSDHPELAYRETLAHDHLASFLEKQDGLEVIRSWGGMKTAFRATFVQKSGKGGLKGCEGRTMGFCSEYDALPGIGHACGHNLIAIAGLGAFLATIEAMKRHDIPGKVVLIGTPAEEGGGGKNELIKMGAFKELDACMMTHPGPGPAHSGSIGGSLAIQVVNVSFHGKTAHAAGAPWEGINALDAANLAYSSISNLRQQIKPAERVHGIIVNGGLAPNVIPDFTSMQYYIRSPTAKGVKDLRARVLKCFEAAALATGCTLKTSLESMHMDLRNNSLLANEFKAVMKTVYNAPFNVVLDDPTAGGGSTDFGNVTYELPACHPNFAIPTAAGQANHTPGFTAAARSKEAHEETMHAALGLAAVGVKVLRDATFTKEAKKWFDEDMMRS